DGWRATPADSLTLQADPMLELPRAVGGNQGSQEIR
ncbi:hypothetical protein Pgy4_41182, partial [Pseudomonas savastanoi pv. glycinea str. race 4]